MHTERANAKINTYLNITSRRPDGYHDIVSVMQTVSLCDLVTVDFYPTPQSNIMLSLSGNSEVPADCNNLAWRAAELFLQHTHLTGVVQIVIQKHIPVSAGLAGGSADAAAVLRALNHLCGDTLTTEELCDIALSIGADVPFCIRGGSMLATGVGEVLTRISDMPFCTVVIAVGEKGVSTPQAYSDLDDTYGFFKAPHLQNTDVEELIELWKNNEIAVSCSCFYNIFEDVIAKKNTDIDSIKRIMRENGACNAIMSGSGPSVFGVFEAQTDAEQACTALQERGYKAFICHPCGQYTE